MKEAMIKYMRESNYMNFRTAVRSGMTYDAYVGIFGEKGIPVSMSSVRGLHLYILAQDVRWVRLITLRTLVKYMATQPYNKELDEYLTQTDDYNFLQSVTISAYTTIKMASVRGLALFVSTLRAVCAVEDSNSVYMYKFIYHHLNTMVAKNENEANTLVYVINMLYKYCFKGECNHEYSDRYALYQEAQAHVEEQRENLMNLREQWEEMDNQNLDRQDTCDMCDFNQNNPTQELVDSMIHRYTKVEQEDGTHKIETFITNRFTGGGAGIQLVGDFCRHCGRNVNDNRRYYRVKGICM